MSSASPQLAPSGSPAAGEFDWSQRVAPIRRQALPKDARGEWAVRAPLSEDAVLLSLIPGTPPSSDAERLKFVSELARLELSTGAIKPLVRLPAGMTVYGPIVAGGTIAWVETSAVDLRAYGWKLHVTDAANGADRVLATDPGARADGVDSVIPVIAYDGSTLLFTVLARRPDGFAWEIHRLKNGREDTIAELPDVRAQRITHVTLDERSIAWVEAVSQSDPHARIGIYDVASGAVSRRRTSLTSVYQIGLAEERMFLATGSGVFEADRVSSSEPKKFAPESASVDQLAVLGRYLLYRNFDPAESLAAIDLKTGAHAVLATNVTAGPVHANGRVLWFERPRGTTPGRIGITGI